MKTLVCKDCGFLMVNVNCNRLFCDVCRKKRILKYRKKYRLENIEKKRIYEQKRAIENPARIAEIRRKSRWKNISHSRCIEQKSRDKYRSKLRECQNLYQKFKTSKINILDKKTMAVIRSIKQNKLTPELMQQINEGNTHVAYE